MTYSRCPTGWGQGLSAALLWNAQPCVYLEIFLLCLNSYLSCSLMPQLFGYTRSSAFISPVPTTHWNSHQPGADYYPCPKIALLSSPSSSDPGNFSGFLLFWFPILLPTCCPMKAGVAALTAGVLGGTGVLLFLIAFGTDYWLLAMETCGVFESGNSTLRTGEVNSDISSYFGRIV